MLNIHPFVIEEPILPVLDSLDSVLGMSCEAFEDEVITLLTAIEVSQNQDGSASPVLLIRQ